MPQYDWDYHIQLKEEKTMTLTINPLSVADAEELLTFELENRAFFESMIPGRPESYFDLNNLKKMLAELELEQAAGDCHLYLIRDEAGTLVGRVNLFSIVRSIFEKAEIGYRIGQVYNGMGYATEAVGLACLEAFEKHKLHRLEAATSTGNIGSQIVLLKNGFEFVGRRREAIKLHGIWQDDVLFERLNPVPENIRE